MRIAMLTPTDESEVAGYARRLIAGLEAVGGCGVEIVPITVGRQPREAYLRQGEICNAPEIDAVHIQYRPEFWGRIAPDNTAFWELRYALKKPIVLTAHTIAPLEELLELPAQRHPLFGLQKRLWLRNAAFRDSVEIAPFATALTLVGTLAERDILVARGAKEAYVAVLPEAEGPPRYRALRNVYKRAIELYNEGPHHPQVTV